MESLLVLCYLIKRGQMANQKKKEQTSTKKGKTKKKSMVYVCYDYLTLSWGKFCVNIIFL